MKLNLKQLEAFVRVADLGSFRKAASRLNTTQPNISSRISLLETALNVTLMHRDAGSVRLTPKGRELLEHARTVLGAAGALIDAADRSVLFDGTLRLGVTEMVAHTWLRDFLRVMKERLPNINVELTVDLSVNIEQDLSQRDIDLALQNGPFRQATTGNADLGTYPLVWLCAPSIGLHRHEQVSLAEMAAHPILVHARNSRLFEEVTAHFASRRGLAVRLVPSSNLAACLHMTVEGMGIATVPAVMATRELASGELVIINHDWTPQALHFVARYDAQKSPAYVAMAAGIASGIAAAYPKQPAACQSAE